MRPTAAEDPRHVGVRRARTRRSTRRYSSSELHVVEVALQHVQAARHRVHVGVLEPGRSMRPAQVDHLGGGPDQVGDAARRCRRPTIRPPFTATACAHDARRVHGVHGAVDEDADRADPLRTLMRLLPGGYAGAAACGGRFRRAPPGRGSPRSRSRRRRRASSAPAAGCSASTNPVSWLTRTIAPGQSLERLGDRGRERAGRGCSWARRAAGGSSGPRRAAPARASSSLRPTGCPRPGRPCRRAAPNMPEQGPQRLVVGARGRPSCARGPRGPRGSPRAPGRSSRATTPCPKREDTRVRLGLPGQDPQEARLAGAVQPHDQQALAAPHVERDVARTRAGRRRPS